MERKDRSGGGEGSNDSEDLLGGGVQGEFHGRWVFHRGILSSTNRQVPKVRGQHTSCMQRGWVHCVPEKDSGGVGASSWFRVATEVEGLVCGSDLRPRGAETFNCGTLVAGSED
jgi:hypothetical protein